MSPTRVQSNFNNSATAYANISADLERRIKGGEWPVGTRFPSRRALAGEYGVGERTIRLALKALEEQGRLIIRPRGKTCTALGKSVHEMLNRAVAIVFNGGVANFLNTAHGERLWRGICGAVEEAGAPVILLQHRTRWRLEYPRGLHHLPIAGALLIGPLKSTQLTQYESLEKPIVVVDQPVAAEKMSCVCGDNYAAAYDATMRLIKLGHRRIAFARAMIHSIKAVDPDSRERHAGFVAACRAGGLRQQDIRVFSTFSSDQATYRSLIELRPAMTAVLCCDVGRALKIVSAATRKGLRIPLDLSVAAFRTDARHSTDVSGPKFDFESMGREAVERLLHPPALPETLRIPAQWHEGKTIAHA